MRKSELKAANVGSRVAREREFHDEESAVFKWARRQLDRATASPTWSWEASDFFNASDKIVLDYGCGTGAIALRLLEAGPERVVCFDLSEVRTAKARSAILARGDDVDADFLTADGHRTPFADHTFDLIIGSAVLHHLDLEVALGEVRRVLKPGGRAVFKEPIAHNPVLRVGRALTPFARTPDEQPLTTTDWQLCASTFFPFRHYERELLTTLFIPIALLLPRIWQRALMRRLEPLDKWLLNRVSFMRKYAHVTILIFE